MTGSKALATQIFEADPPQEGVSPTRPSRRLVKRFAIQRVCNDCFSYVTKAPPSTPLSSARGTGVATSCTAP
jgi:hypothetical protein